VVLGERANAGTVQFISVGSTRVPFSIWVLLIKEWDDKGIHRKTFPVSALVTPQALAR
jgi:hypothetical protein